ncbi:MAG: fused MFS/spermidine synthase [Gemmatimonadetes bacterium]|nr:fused MFS/spermidine synthase [Gemmatimonadota bacterium]
MARPDNTARLHGAMPGRFLPGLLLLFVGSGCAALIYEVVWFQMLQFVVGASGISLGVLLGTFMGGMFLGSLALPRYVPIERHPLRVYAVIEVVIGVIGLSLLWVIPWVGTAYASFVSPGLPSIIARSFLTGLVLLPPTVLMGATLPAIARYVETTPKGVSWMGFFYGGNIAGAVIGSLLAGFYLLRVYDIPTATAAAALINFAVAAIAYRLSKVADHEPRVDEETKAAPVFARRSRVVYGAIAISGLTALGAEVIWTRLLSLVLGATTYTFSIILAVFLAALGVGSAAGSYLARTVDDPRRAFGVCQALVIVSLAWSAYVILAALPYWPINPSITTSAWFTFQIDLVRAVCAMLPAPLFWGASFPLAVAAAAERGQDPGRLMGSVYAANTAGAILGALGFGLILIPWIGTQNAQRVLILCALAATAMLLWPWILRGGSSTGPGKSARLTLAGLGLAGTMILTWSVPALPPVLVAYGRYAATYQPPITLYMGEGMSSSIAVTELDNGDRNIHVGGKIVASTEAQDMRLQRLLGHMTALLAPNEPRSVLVVGFGAGVTAGTFVTHPGIERIVIAEIEPLITEVASKYFALASYDVLNDPRVEVVHDDARHFLLTTDETFDLITADPIHPWMKGAAALYTEEYFELALEHLNPGGVITQWVPLYESTSDVVKSELATFFRVFPEGTVWANTIDGEGYDILLAATRGDVSIDVDAFTDRFNDPDHSFVALSLAEVGIMSANALLATYAGRARDLAPWLEDSQINRDRDLRLMYLAGLRLNRYEEASIYRELRRYREFPEDLFVGSPERVGRLRRSLGFE